MVQFIENRIVFIQLSRSYEITLVHLLSYPPLLPNLSLSVKKKKICFYKTCLTPKTIFSRLRHVVNISLVIQYHIQSYKIIQDPLSIGQYVRFYNNIVGAIKTLLLE